MSTQEFPRSLSIGLSVLLVAIVVSGVTDLFLDDLASLGVAHAANEIAMILLSLFTAIYLWSNLLRTSRSLTRIRGMLEEREHERDLWRERAQTFLEGLGQEIDTQLREWSLTPTERQTALLLLKGLSLKQIAELHQRSERTVRQHAIAVYRKSGLKGRAELSAFFLEDLLLPRD